MKAKTVLLIGILLTVGGKSTHAQIQWNIKGGINSSNIIVTEESGIQEDPTSRIGFSLGIGVDIKVGRYFSIQPMLQYAKRGFVVENTYSVGWGTHFKANTSHLELPVDFVYSPAFGNGNLLLGVGPYVGYGTGGRWRTDNLVLLGDIMIDNQGELVFQNDASYSDYGTYVHARPWDYGLHGKVGYIFLGHYLIQLEYQHGLKNLEPRWNEYISGSSLKNKAWGLSIGYQF